MKPFRQSHAPRKLIWKPQVHNGHALQSDANIFDCCWFHLNVKLFVRVMARTLLARTGSTSGQRWRQVQRWAMRKMKYSHNAACHAGDWKLWKHNASARAKRRRMADGKWEIGNGRGQVYSCSVKNGKSNQSLLLFRAIYTCDIPHTYSAHSTHMAALWMCIAIDVTLSHFSRASIIQGDYICK